MSKELIATGVLRGYLNRAVGWLEARDALSEIPDARLLVSRIRVQIASPENVKKMEYTNSRNFIDISLAAGYNQKKHHVFIRCFTPNYTDENPERESVAWISSFVHELAHILLKADEDKAFMLTYEVLTQLGINFTNMPPDEWINGIKEYYEDRGIAWRPVLGPCPYLEILKGQMTKKEATAWFTRRAELEKRDRLGRLTSPQKPRKQ